MKKFFINLWKKLSDYDWRMGYRAGVYDYKLLGRKVAHSSILMNNPSWVKGYNLGFNDQRIADRLSKGYYRQ